MYIHQKVRKKVSLIQNEQWRDFLNTKKGGGRSLSIEEESKFSINKDRREVETSRTYILKWSYCLTILLELYR